MRKDDSELLRRLAGERPAAGGPGRQSAAGGTSAGDATAPPPAHRPAADERSADPAEDRSRLAALWAALEPPPAEPAPPGFTGRVMARVREEAPRRDTLTRRFGVLPARLAAASALSAGLVAGAGLGALIATPAGERREVTVAAASGEVRPGGAATAAGRSEAHAPADPASGEAAGRVAPGEAGRPSGEELPSGVAVAAGGEARASADAGAGGTAATAGEDDDALLAAAVAAAAGPPAGPVPEVPDAAFGAEPDLAGDYLAALAALGEAS
jgi:hypothetical protein